MYNTRNIFRILMKLEYFREIFGKSQISNYVKLSLVGVELLCAEKQTDRRREHKTNSPYLQSCKQA